MRDRLSFEIEGIGKGKNLFVTLLKGEGNDFEWEIVAAIESASVFMAGVPFLNCLPKVRQNVFLR